MSSEMQFYEEAVKFVIETQRASITSLQRKFRIRFDPAARLIEKMEEDGVVSCRRENGKRYVLRVPDSIENIAKENGIFDRTVKAAHALNNIYEQEDTLLGAIAAIKNDFPDVPDQYLIPVWLGINVRANSHGRG